MVDSVRRQLLKTSAAAAAMAATASVFAQQGGHDSGGRVYQRGNVRIRYDETGSGFPLLIIGGGDVDGSTIEGMWGGNPFNAIEALKGELRCVYVDLRNSAGQSTGPLDIDRPRDSYTDDHIGLMDHLGIDKRQSRTRTGVTAGAGTCTGQICESPRGRSPPLCRRP